MAITLGLVATPVASRAAPRTPTDDREVLERLPLRPGDSSARELARLRALSVAAPQDPSSAADLAQQYFELATARGDPRYIGYADAALRPFAQSPSAAIRLVRGQLLQYRHQFDAALGEFTAALAQDPQLAAAHAWRGAIFLVQANYPAAHTECNALLALGRRVLYGGCAGLAQAYSGHLADGYAALQQALERSSNPDSQLWLLTRLAEVAAWRGHTAAAEQHYRAALRLDIDDGYLLAAWSDFLLDQHRPGEVVTLLASWESSDSLLLRLALAESQLQLPAAQRHIQAIDDRFAAARLRADTTHRAEQSRFELQLRGNAAAALELAAANYAEQREPRDARVLLEASLAARHAGPAQPVLAWLQSSGFEDPRLRQMAAALQPVSTGPAESTAPK